MGNIEKNLAVINNIISAAAIKSGRRFKDIKLIGVTKTVEPERIRQLILTGETYGADVICLGESRVQEFLPKYEALQEPLIPIWHFIGHLQRNKVKFIIGKVSMIHSVDSLALAQEIDKHANQAGCIMDILVEINIAGEDSKHGIRPEETLSFVENLMKFSNIQVRGLMCIAPFVENPENNRHFFKKMRNLLLDIKAQHPHNHSLTELSMGMSGDYAVAIEEGATMVRIGTALFG